MNNWKLRSVITGTNTDDLVEVNGYLAAPSTTDVPVLVVPFGNQYAASLRTTASDNFGPVSNQVPGICNGTFTHTTSANGQVASTALTGEGSGATFFYSFLADGTLSSITAATAGSGYKVGDKLEITTNQGHVIQFRLVDGSNATSLGITIPHDRNAPLPYAVHRARVNSASEHTFHVYDYRSSQVFPKPQDKLLDKYPDAAAAYGLRLLRSAYLGPAIKVRRDSDNATKDIGFSGGNLDTATLLAFAGSQTVTVDTWYDQSGGGNDASQSGTSNQPTIVDAGTLVTVNGKPALEFDGSDDHMVATGVTTTQPTTATAVATSANTNGYIFDGDDSSSRQAIIRTITNGWTAFAGQEMRTEYSGLEQLFHYAKFEGTTSDYYIDGTSFLTDVNGGTQVLSGLDIGQRYNDTARLNGTIQEIVLWSADQSANREDIQKEYSDYYQNFQVEDAPLLDAYGGAHAAYSLRKLNSDYTGAAIRARRGVDGSELDIGFKADGTLDLDALTAFSTGSIYIKTWYDQSGNGNDVTQTATAKQPYVQSGVGTIQKVDGRIAARFDGTDALPFDNTGLDIGNLSSFMVCKFSNTTGLQFPLVLSAGDPKRFYPPVLSGGVFSYTYGSSTAIGTATANTNNNLHSMIAGATQGDAEAFLNGSTVGTKALASGVGSFTDGIGGVNGDDFLNGFIQEIVVYSSDQSERREGIERNISNHYDL